MKQYMIKQQKVKKVEKIICNQCGKEIPILNGRAETGVCTVENHWGYESEKDGEHHVFDLCEECYDKLVESFAIPV